MFPYVENKVRSSSCPGLNHEQWGWEVSLGGFVQKSQGFHAMFQREQSLKPFLMSNECSQVSWCHQQSTAPNLCLEKPREAKGILLSGLKGAIFPT